MKNIPGVDEFDISEHVISNNFDMSFCNIELIIICYQSFQIWFQTLHDDKDEVLLGLHVKIWGVQIARLNLLTIREDDIVHFWNELVLVGIHHDMVHDRYLSGHVCALVLALRKIWDKFNGDWSVRL